MNLIRHTFKYRVAGVWQDVSTIDLFKNKKVVLFGLPGAFTPTCSSKQLPGYEEQYNKFKGKQFHNLLLTNWTKLWIWLQYFEKKEENIKVKLI